MARRKDAAALQVFALLWKTARCAEQARTQVQVSLCYSLPTILLNSPEIQDVCQKVKNGHSPALATLHKAGLFLRITSCYLLAKLTLSSYGPLKEEGSR